MPRTAGQLTRQGIFEHWLAGHLVALMGAQMPVTTVRDWSARRLLDNFEHPNPGKNNPRKYSFVNAVQLHGMYQARLGGTNLDKAAMIGRACVERFLAKFDQGDREFLDWPDDPWLLMKYQFDRRGEFSKQFLTYDEFAQEWTSGIRGHLGVVVSAFDVDMLLHKLWRHYVGFDDRINELALAGKLKRFPEYLK